jgi:rhodanese-related sulfurtransferase
MGILSSFFEGKQVNNLNAELFAEKINQNQNAVLLDVRTVEEYIAERIPNSMLIDIYKPDFIMNIEKLDRSKSYFIYCRSGSRSSVAANEMVKLGFENVYNLKNGIISWQGDVERG